MKREPLLRQMTAAVLCLALGPAGNALAEGSTSGREVSIVIEEGDKVPTQVLDALAAQELGTGTTAEVTFSVVEGQARLVNVDGQMVDAASGGSVAHPEIIAGPHYDETYVQMLADGKPLGRPMRIGTIASGSLDQLLATDVPPGSEALLNRASDYAVVDTGLLRSQASVNNKEAPTGQYCATILDKERDVYGYSRVAARACSDRSDQEAFAEAQSKVGPSGASVQYTAYIIGFAEHAGYGGRFQKVYGLWGDCDWAGYAFRTWDVDPYWESSLSSTVRPYGRCYFVRYRKRSWCNWCYTDWSPTRTLSDWYVGDYYNDRITHVKVWG